MYYNKEKIISPIEKFNLDRRFKAARKASLSSSFSSIPRQRMGAAIFNGSSKPVSNGANQRKTHSIVDKYTIDYGFRKKHVTIHAEISCILNTSRDKLEGGVIFVWREDNSGMPRIAKPCMMCADLLLKAGIKKAVFTTSAPPYFGELKIPEMILMSQQIPNLLRLLGGGD